MALWAMAFCVGGALFLHMIGERWEFLAFLAVINALVWIATKSA